MGGPVSAKGKRSELLGNMTYNQKLSARNKIIARGQDPIDMMYEIFELAKEAYVTGRGVTEKSDPGAGYLSVAGSMAQHLAKFVYPTLTAAAIKIDDGTTEKRQLDMKEAISIIAEDPFAKAAIHAIQFQKERTPAEVEADKITIDLPKGNK